MNPELVSGLRLIFALIFTLSLFGIVMWFLRRYGQNLGDSIKGSSQRLGILEARSIDARHRLVLVRRDDREHLLLLTQNGPPLVVESGISRAEAHANPIGPAR